MRGIAEEFSPGTEASQAAWENSTAAPGLPIDLAGNDFRWIEIYLFPMVAGADFQMRKVSEYESESIPINSALAADRGLQEALAMIEVTRLNGNPMVINSDLIKIAEQSPDTMLTLIHGEKLIVRESCEEIVEKVLVYRARLLASVAAVNSSEGELHSIVALASLNPASGREEALTAVDGAKSAPKLRVEQGGRQG
jgi:flagellar protein FlbD